MEKTDLEKVMSYPGIVKTMPVDSAEAGVTNHSDGDFLYEVGTAKPNDRGCAVVVHSIAADGIEHLVSKLKSMGTGSVLYVHLQGRSPGLEVMGAV